VLTICGDSWFSTDTTYPGCSFSEILCNKHNLQLKSLARAAISNFGIALQVDKAIQMNSDFIIVGCTTWDRIELPSKPKSAKLFDWKTGPTDPTTDTQYDPNLGLLNVIYSRNFTELSGQHANTDHETIISETILSLHMNRHKYHLDDTFFDSLKHYMTHIYDSGIKQQIDCWIMSEAARRLQQSKIPFLLYCEPLFTHDFIQNIQWLDKKYRVMYNDFGYYQYRLFESNFHLSLEDSENFAQHWENRLKTEGFLIE
jgi:hypothetical protein